MTMYRTVHNKNFTTINNFICKDNRLSWKAKGIWLYAFSRPDDWTFYKQDLINQSTDGESSVESGLKELENCGYLIRTQKRDEEGRFACYEWSFYETPQEFKKCLPEGDFPAAEKPDPENQALLNTDIPNTEKTNIARSQETIPRRNNNSSSIFFDCLEKCSDLSDSQKRLLMKFSEESVEKAIRYVYHENTKVEGGPIGRLKLMQFLLKAPDLLDANVKDLENPSKIKTSKDILSKFQHGETYNGYEFSKDNIGVGFFKKGMSQPYSVNWKVKDFAEQFVNLLKKLNIVY